MSKAHKLNISLFVLYIIFATFVMIYSGIGITPDRYTFVLILPILLIHKLRKFLMDWLPFIFLLISYDFFRGLAAILNPNAHYLEPAQADLALFGYLPTNLLQRYFYTPGQIQWYDFVSAFFYFLHFALPLAFAFILWLKTKHYFKQFTSSLILLSYASFLTYLLYPAAPPWLASEKDLIPQVHKILNIALLYFPERLSLPTLYHSLNANLVAAIPSLHAAYPLLVFLYALKIFKTRALLFFPYVLGVWISIVYLGEHYVIDVVLGALYAAVFYFAPTWGLILYLKFKKRFQRKTLFAD